MKLKLFIVSVFIICSLWPVISLAQNKVVVIPLEESVTSDPETLRALCRGYEAIGKKPPPQIKCPPKLVFIYISVSDAGFGGVSGANALCQSAANNNEFKEYGWTSDRKFKAWISDASSSPAASFIHSTTPYVSPSYLIAPIAEHIIANDWSDLTDGTIKQPIDVPYTTGVGWCDTIWTATTVNGEPMVPAVNCNNWTSKEYKDYGWYGRPSSSDGTEDYLDYRWTHMGDGQSCAYLGCFYCFEQ